MLYKFLVSKKGFTLTELMVVIVVMSVLVAVAVPVFNLALDVQKRNDCQNQRKVIETAVKQAMYGMIDHGKKQEKIKLPEDQTYLKLTGGTDCFTLGVLRGGYRPDTITEYRDGCAQGYYLKKKSMENVYFYTFLSNQEIPVCPFTDKNNSYYYYIDENGSVYCSCAECQ